MNLTHFEMLLVWIGFLSPVVVAIDASIQKIPFLRDTYEPSDPVKWFFFTFFLWCLVAPYYLFHRWQVRKARRASKEDGPSDI